MSESETTPATTKSLPPQPIAAKAGSYYRNMRYLMFAVMCGMGAWFLYDGFVKYPEHNRAVLAMQDEIKQIEKTEPAGEDRDVKIAKLSSKLKEKGDLHQDDDIRLQKLLGYALPPLALAFLGFVLWKSRGSIVLDQDQIAAPGHPAIPLTAINGLDNDKWSRKGIAVASYKLADGTEGDLVLDDFIYERGPIDAIHEHITASLKARQGHLGVSPA